MPLLNFQQAFSRDRCWALSMVPFLKKSLGIRLITLNPCHVGRINNLTSSKWTFLNIGLSSLMHYLQCICHHHCLKTCRMPDLSTWDLRGTSQTKESTYEKRVLMGIWIQNKMIFLYQLEEGGIGCCKAQLRYHFIDNTLKVRDSSSRL